MKEISNRSDVELLVDKFYEKVVRDDTIGFFFTDVVKLDMEVHIPIMYDFWETILLGNIKYEGNPMVKHIELDKKEKMKPEHFSRWLELWKETIHENFEGGVADEAINRAQQIGELMKFKVGQNLG